MDNRRIVHATFYNNDKVIFTHFSVGELLEEGLKLDFNKKMILYDKKDIRVIIELYNDNSNKYNVYWRDILYIELELLNVA